MANPEPEILPPERDSQPPKPPQEERTWGMLCHLSAFAGYVFPFGHIFGPLLVYLLKGENYPLAKDQGRESLNFQLSMTLYFLAAGLLTFAIIGYPLLALLSLFHLIFTIVASVKANGGERYRYPLTIRFLR